MLGPDHVETLRTRWALTTTLSESGDYAAAPRHSRAALRHARLIYGEDHPHTCHIAVAHAADLRFTRALAAARELTADLVERHGPPGDEMPAIQSGRDPAPHARHRAGPGTGDGGTSRSCRHGWGESPEVANAYDAVGNSLAALEFGLAARDDLVDLLGARHPVVLGMSVNVAMDAHRCGKGDSRRDAVREFAAVIGARHPMVTRVRGHGRFSQDIDIYPW
ncbi:hypothetical protein [Actinoplanes aureus]|uniref:Tetratricopeptide repeat protein n=1 Tax=Actinoplanes aureus TaxID=2792083 RepID=A0A931C9I9_9ACTN|nr:hypothetical protein [Actinoplanes aureus]MBG0565895.1 hypothetical protein [Actinoplanes aureus]